MAGTACSKPGPVCPGPVDVLHPEMTRASVFSCSLPPMPYGSGIASSSRVLPAVAVNIASLAQVFPRSPFAKVEWPRGQLVSAIFSRSTPTLGNETAAPIRLETGGASHGGDEQCAGTHAHASAVVPRQRGCSGVGSHGGKVVRPRRACAGRVCSLGERVQHHRRRDELQPKRNIIAVSSHS